MLLWIGSEGGGGGWLNKRKDTSIIAPFTIGSSYPVLMGLQGKGEKPVGAGLVAGQDWLCVAQLYIT